MLGMIESRGAAKLGFFVTGPDCNLPESSINLTRITPMFSPARPNFYWHLSPGQC